MGSDPLRIVPRESDLLLVQDNTEERSIDLKTAVVLNEAELSEFVHEKIEPRACWADHLCQRFLRYFGEQSVGLVFLAVTGKQQKRAGEPLLARVEQLVDQVLLDSNVPCQHESDEPVGKVMLLVKYLEHFTLLNNEHGARGNRGSRLHANRLARQTAFAKEVARSQNGDDRLFAAFTNHGELHPAFL